MIFFQRGKTYIFILQFISLFVYVTKTLSVHSEVFLNNYFQIARSFIRQKMFLRTSVGILYLLYYWKDLNVYINVRFKLFFHVKH